MPKKNREKRENNGSAYGEERLGTVVRTAGGSSWVAPEGDPVAVECKVKGKFRLKGIRTTNPVAVGDKVKFREGEGGIGYITEIFPRSNYIIRRSSNLSKEAHILGTNIDQAILIATLKHPETPIVFIDRFLATCEAYNVKAVLVINKADLFDEDCKELAEGMRVLYEGIGYRFIVTSVETGEGIEELRKATKDKLSLMAGNSGVGKSSLINTLVPGANLRTGEISEMHLTGMHTTTYSEMIHLPYGGDIIDIPGVKGFGMIDFTEEEVSHYFPEIFKASEGCRYGDCRHTGEPGCAVKEMVENHYISQSRYNSYLNILEEIAEEGKYRKAY